MQKQKSSDLVRTVLNYYKTNRFEPSKKVTVKFADSNIFLIYDNEKFPKGMIPKEKGEALFGLKQGEFERVTNSRTLQENILEIVACYAGLRGYNINYIINGRIINQKPN